jgi:hypothetical protein
MSELFRITTAKSGTTNVSSKPSEISVINKEDYTDVEPPPLEEIVEIASGDSSIENRLNAQRLKRFRTDFSSKFLQLLREQDFEYGVDTPADELVRKCFHENEAISKEWINNLFVQNFSDQTVLMGILRVLSHFNYQEVAPQGPTIALAALVNASAEVRECGIRAFENWSSLHSLKVLENVKCEEKWLDDYLKQVIADLREELS